MLAFTAVIYTVKYNLRGEAMIFGRRKKERVEKHEQILNNQMKQFQIERFKTEFRNKAHTDYKESLQNLVNELVSADLKENAPNGLPSKGERQLRG